jgi:hypothetical protein
MAGWHNNTSSSIAASSTSEDEQGRIAAMTLTMGDVVPAAITALVKLDVFEAFGRAGNNNNNNGAQASLTAQEIATLAMPGKSINMGYLERLLRILASHKVFSETVAPCLDDANKLDPIRRFGLTPISKSLVKNDTAGSLAHSLVLREQTFPMMTFSRIHEAVLENKPDHEPFKIAHGMHIWEYEAQQKNAQEAELVNQMLLNQSKWNMHAILEKYEGFKDVRVLVDVGGGLGTALGAITELYPHIHGINFDLPHVIASCLPLQGVDFVGGDMFKSVPSGDAIFMKWILHNWDDDDNIKLLKNCHAALPAKGKVIVVEYVLPEITNPDSLHDKLAFHMDFVMLAMFVVGARERTEREIRQLALAAGFAQVNFIVDANALSIIEMHKLDS